MKKRIKGKWQSPGNEEKFESNEKPLADKGGKNGQACRSMARNAQLLD